MGGKGIHVLRADARSGVLRLTRYLAKRIEEVVGTYVWDGKATL